MRIISNSLTIVAHSNGGFVAMVATTLGLKINHLIHLGYALQRQYWNTAAEIVHNITCTGKMDIVQGNKDKYTTIREIKEFINEYHLKINLYKLPGNHHFGSFENMVKNILTKIILPDVYA